MNDEPADPRTDPEAEAVRRLLADARHTEPMPEVVAARMDAVLADLAGSAGDPGHDGVEPAPPPVPPVVRTVVPLDVHRRRRAAGMLVAAAAIVVGGVVLAQHLPGSGSQSGASTAAGRAESDSAVGDTGAGKSREPGTAPLQQRVRAAKVRDGLVLVRPQHFTADALAARRLVDAKAPPSVYADLSRAEALCRVPGPTGRRVAASYQRAPAVLVFHDPGSGSQVVDLYLCHSSRPLRSATLPSP